MGELLNDKQPLRKRMLVNLVKWVIGVALLILIPVLLPFAAIVAIFYYIPVTIGGWIYNMVMKI